MDAGAPQTLLDFTGQVVVVTGGGGNLGAAICRRFAQAGADVVVNYYHSQAAARQVVEEIEGLGRRAVAVQADVSEEQGAAELLAASLQAFGRVDVWVNNAGNYPVHALLEMTAEDWDWVVDANLRSTFLCTQTAVRQMVAQGGGGRIVNIASIEGLNPAPGHSHYVAAKAGVIGFTQAAAHEFGPQGIRINAVSPGLIGHETLEEDWPEGVFGYRKAAALGREGQPVEVADACLFLASAGARWITGANLVVDGGVLTNRVY